MKILVVGAGAVGGYFGARLEQAGRDVTFLVRPARAQQLRRDGLRILSPHGDLTLKPKIITAQEISGPYDIIFLSVKAQALDQAIKDMSAAVGPETMIYPVLNGMRHIKTLTKAFGERASWVESVSSSPIWTSRSASSRSRRRRSSPTANSTERSPLVSALSMTPFATPASTQNSPPTSRRRCGRSG